MIKFLFLSLTSFFLFATAREDFPADEPVGDTDSEDYAAYFQGLIMYSFGAGIGLGGVFFLFMSICWLCNCCRGGKKKAKPGEELPPVDGAEGVPKGQKTVKGYFIVALAIFVMFIGVAFGIFGTVGTATDSFVLVLDDTEVFMDQTANLLCKDTDVNGCDNGIGKLISDTNDEFVDVCDEIVDFIASVRNILNQINNTQNEISDMLPYLEEMKVQAIYIKDNASDAQQRIAYLSNPANTAPVDLSSSLPDASSFPTVTDEQLSAFDEAIYGVGNATNEMDETYSTVNTTIEEALGDLEDSVDGVGENDDRNSVTDTLDDLEKSCEDSAESMLDTSDAVGGFGDTTEDNKDNIANGITLLMFIPAIIHLLSMVCMGLCCKKGGRAPLFGNMCFNYWAILIYSLLAGAILLFSLINEDICDSHMDFLRSNLDTNTSFGNSSVNLADTVEDILKCHDDQNLIELLGFEGELNITDQLSSTLDLLDESEDMFEDSFSSLNSTSGDLSELTEALAVDFMNGTSLDEAEDEIESALATPGLPTDVEYNLTLILNDINNINASIIRIEELQVETQSEYDDIEDSLDQIGTGIDISGVTAEIFDVIDTVAGAASYTRCYFIGDYYTETYLVTWCDDLIGSTSTMGYLMILNALLMFITFCCSGYYAPYLRKNKNKVSDEYVGPENEIELVGGKGTNMPMTSGGGGRGVIVVPPPGHSTHKI